MHQVDEAIACLQDSLAIRRSIEDRAGQAATLRRLGNAQRDAGDLRLARGFLAEALRLNEDLGDDAKVAEIRAALSEIADAAD
jgi:tetratricopeptide (TPR) repeat protein